MLMICLTALTRRSIQLCWKAAWLLTRRLTTSLPLSGSNTALKIANGALWTSLWTTIQMFQLWLKTTATLSNLSAVPGKQTVLNKISGLNPTFPITKDLSIKETKSTIVVQRTMKMFCFRARGTTVEDRARSENPSRIVRLEETAMSTKKPQVKCLTISHCKTIFLALKIMQ
jgi:hypothetical protein